MILSPNGAPVSVPAARERLVLPAGVKRGDVLIAIRERMKLADGAAERCVADGLSDDAQPGNRAMVRRAIVKLKGGAK